MSILATNNSVQRELIPSGNYIARCYQMIEIGTVSEIIMGKAVTLKKVRIGWELPTEMRIFKQENGEQPISISREYTLSMHEKSNLRRDLKSWRGKDFTEAEAKAFDITNLIGVPCMLNIIHKFSKSDTSKKFEEIAGITGVPKGVPVPAQVNKNFVLSYDSFDKELFNSLPDFIKIKMQGSLEFTRLSQPQHQAIEEYEDLNSEINNGPYNSSNIEPYDDLPF